MPDLPRSHLAVYAVAFAAIALLGARQLARDAGGASDAVATEPAPISVGSAADGEAGGGESVMVHVAGEVRRPGVYRMRAGQRVDDAVGRAGGPTRRANTDGLNLAAKVQDGRQIVVPARASAAAGGAGAGSGAAAAQATTGGVAGAAGVAGAPVNLNTATLEQLDALDGVGPGIAQDILDHREASGGFTSVEELGEIPGIGEKRLASLRAQVTV